MERDLRTRSLSKALYLPAAVEFEAAGERWLKREREALLAAARPSEAQARHHLEIRLSAAQLLSPTFSAFLAQCLVAGVLGPLLLGVLVGVALRAVVVLTTGTPWSAASLGAIVALGVLVTLLLLHSIAVGRTSEGGFGLTGAAWGLVLSAFVAALVLQTATAAAMAAVAVVMVALVLWAALARFRWALPAELAREPDVARLNLYRGTAASDRLLWQFERVHIPWSGSAGLRRVPLPVAVLVAPESLARLYPSLHELAEHVADWEWDVYHRQYSALADLTSPLRRIARAAGADVALVGREHEGLAVRVL